MNGSGFSKDRLQRMHEVMAGHVESGALPGLVMLVSRRGEAQADAIGKKTLGNSELMRRDTLFRIASMSKPVAAVAAMMLVEECRLRLDDPVDTWLPELAARRVLKRGAGALDETIAAGRPITLRDLLTLRMGLGHSMTATPADPLQSALADAQLLQGPPRPQAWPAPDAWLQRVAALPLLYQPGEQWMYDLGIDVLGVLISRASGQPLDVFMRERIFTPLGMKDTGFCVSAAQQHRLATSYHSGKDENSLEVYDPALGGEWSRAPAFPAAASGLVSSADDYLAFANMLLNGGRHGRERLLSRPSVQLMTMDHLTPGQRAHADPILGTHRGWGFGMAVNTRRDDLASVPGRFGWDGGLGTSWACDPSEGLIGILMTQRALDSPTLPAAFTDFWTLAYQAIDD